MSDRVCVMSQGRILQSASPADIYQMPACRQVAEFIGQTNFVSGRVTEVGADGLTVTTRWGPLKIARAPRNVTAGQSVTISARPESIRLVACDGSAGPDGLRGRIAQRIYLGNLQEFWVDLSDMVVRVQAPVSDRFGEGDRVTLAFDPQSMAVVEAAP